MKRLTSIMAAGLILLTTWSYALAAWFRAFTGSYPPAGQSTMARFLGLPLFERTHFVDGTHHAIRSEYHEAGWAVPICITILVIVLAHRRSRALAR